MYLIVVPRFLPQQEKNKSADVQRERVHFARVQRRIIRVRVIMTAANCSPAVASRRAKYVDVFRSWFHGKDRTKK
jgi:hypothetical protein